VRFIRRDNNEMNVAAASSSRLTGGERGGGEKGGREVRQSARIPAPELAAQKPPFLRSARLAASLTERKLSRVPVEMDISFAFLHAARITSRGPVPPAPPRAGEGATRARDTLANAVRPKSATEIGNTGSSHPEISGNLYRKERRDLNSEVMISSNYASLRCVFSGLEFW